MIHNRIFELKNTFKNVAGDKQSRLKLNRVTTASLGNTQFFFLKDYNIHCFQ